MAVENPGKPTTTKKTTLSPERMPPHVRRAFEDAEWATSPGYKQMKTRHILITGISAVVFVLGLLMFGVVMSTREPGQMPLELLALWLSVALIGYLGIFFVILDRARLRRLYRDTQALELADELQEREQSLADSGEPLSLAALWAVTQQRIEYYHQIVTTQSEVSFKNGAVTSYVGLGLLLALAGVATFNTGDLATSITIGALGAVGAALSGYLGATFIRLQSESAAQLREFFSQPVEFSRLLGAERLIEYLPADQRAQAVQLVIEAMMRERKAEK